MFQPGFIYLCLKHFVDKHNLYFVYLPSKIDPVIHVTAINFVIIAVFVLIMTLLAFIVLQAGLYFYLFIYLCLQSL